MTRLQWERNDITTDLPLDLCQLEVSTGETSAALKPKRSHHLSLSKTCFLFVCFHELVIAAEKEGSNPLGFSW